MASDKADNSFFIINNVIIKNNNQIIEKVLCICNKKSFATVMIKDQSNFVILATGLYNALQCCCDEKHSLAIQQMAHHIIGLLMDHDMDFITSLSQ